jgi:nucleoside-diphosphate-sugar epimerase
MPVVSARPVNLFGPGDPAYTRIVPAAMRAILDGKGIPVHHHAVNMVRDFLYVKDAARMIYKLATSETREAIYNLSAGFFKSILEVANTITATLNHGVRPALIDKPGEYSEIPAQVIDGSRFVREFGFEFTKFEDAIRETYESYQ